MPKFTGLGRGLGSLIPTQKIFNTVELEERTSTSSLSGGNDIQNQKEVETHLISVNPRQPRRNFSEAELEEMMASIKEHGILQPLLVTRIDDRYELIAGERRLRAAKLLALPKVPVYIREEVSERQKLEFALIENIQRQDLNPIEEAMAYQSLVDDFDLTQEEIAIRVGKSRPKVANMLRLLRLPETIKEAISKNLISEGHAKVIAGLQNERDQMELFQRIVQFKLPVNVAGDQVKSMTRRQPKREIRIDPWIQQKQELLQNALGTKVVIQAKDNQGKIIIEFFDREDLESIVENITS